MTLNISPQFRRMATIAIANILLFIIVYLLLIVVAGFLVALCVAGGVGLIMLRPGFLTLAIGIGIAAMGVFVMIFLIKFIFKKHSSDRSHLVEITRDQQPELFAFIKEIVDKVHTDFPKKIYLSSEVNAAVFYDSSFWSMFLPIRKNLQIGAGLINTVSAEELRAILAHEFGHFSQRSMKIGSYVYNVNQVIFNMLHDNEGYGNIIQRWASISGYFAFFVNIAIRIIQGIQWVLGRMYGVVNLSYMKLSREMEFHADEVAAHAAGSKPLISSLLRMDLADYSYNTVIEYYNGKIDSALTSANIYPKQQFVMNFYARENDLDIEHNLPQVKTGLGRFRSKLVIKNQWASHPSTEDRVQKLEALNLSNTHPDPRSAKFLFENMQELEARLTGILFSSVRYENPATTHSTEEFIEDFSKSQMENVFNPVFNGYYDLKHPVYGENEYLQIQNTEAVSAVELFSNKNVDSLYEVNSLESDLQTLKQIETGNYQIKSFDYNGKKYQHSECRDLVALLELELEDQKAAIRKHDLKIYAYFVARAEQRFQRESLNTNWNSYLLMDKATDEKFALYSKMANATQFIHQQTSFEEIDRLLNELKTLEIELKSGIQLILDDINYQQSIDDDCRVQFSAYLERELNYFVINEYDDKNLKILFGALNSFHQVLSKSFIHRKKNLLEFQASLIG